ncbi:MAG: TonB family protein [Candidatus Acidiferrales bacterium]
MTESWKNWEGQVADGQFHLRRFLGATDRSAVFLTDCPAQESHVAAIKFIPADPDTGEIQLTRWRLAAKLSHPHLARIYASGRCLLGNMSLLYVVMEHAEEDLSQILPQRALTQAEVRELLPPVLDALAYLHGEGFVHNRLKPANIMAVVDQLKISSDGIRRAAKSSGNQSKPGPYDPPEAATGVITPAGDVWSLGMTVVETLTQRLPAWEHFSDGEPSLPGALPAPFCDLARHCLRRDPTFRWTITDIAHWLNPDAVVLQSQPPAAQTVNSAPASSPVARQSAAPPPKMFVNWRYAIPVGVMALVIIAMLAGPRLFNRRMEAQPAPSSASKHARPQPKSNSGSEPGEASPATPSPAPLPASLKTSQPAAKPEPPAKSTAAGLVPGQVLEQALPEVSEKARDSIQGTVRVSIRVEVDPSGSVSDAALNSPSPSKYFADLALHVAPRWKFFPATLNGQNVSSEWILRFNFSNSGTTVHPSQATP